MRCIPKLIEVEGFTAPVSLNEIYQQTGMLFAFVTSPAKGSKQCHKLVKCRDFLADAVRTQLTGNTCIIYGFKFDTKNNPPVDLNKMRMLVTKELKVKDQPKFKQQMRSALKLLNHYEDMVKISKTKIKEVKLLGQAKYKLVYLFTGSVAWMKSPFLVSMYSFLIRLGDKELQFTNNTELKEGFKKLADDFRNGKTSDNDAGYLVRSWNYLDVIMKKRTNLFTSKDRMHTLYWDSTNISQFHNYTGIDSLIQKRTPDRALNQKMKKLISRGA